MLIKTICLGDVVGRPGREALKKHMPGLIATYAPTLIITNGENAAGGAGIEPGCVTDLLHAGVHVITLGDHTFQRKESKSIFADPASPCIRPANFPPGTPGKQFQIVERQGFKIGITNLMGRVFISVPLECPFRCIDALLSGPLSECALVIVDMHAEASSEKIAMAHHLDGRAALIFGTHTHVQTADEQISAHGTGFIGDLGMCGSHQGVIGMDKEVALLRFLTSMPHAYKIAEGDGGLRGIYAELDPENSRCTKIERIKIG